MGGRWARLDGAVMDAIGEVGVLAKTGNVGLATAERLGLAKHAGDAVLLQQRSVIGISSTIDSDLHRIEAGTQRHPERRQGRRKEQRQQRCTSS